MPSQELFVDVGTPDAFMANFPKPVICYVLGKNLYEMLVRARVAT
jgi:hypothetical protein